LSVALRAEQRVAWVKKKKIPFFSEREKRLSGCPRVKIGVSENARENPLEFETTPPDTLFEGSFVSLFFEKIASYDWNDGYSMKLRS